MIRISLFLLLFATDVLAAKNLIYCMEGSPATFNPQLASDSVSLNASSQAVFNRLVEFKKGSTEIAPSLALSWTISKDRKVYTFKLRKDVLFHANEFFKPTRNLNANDVVYTFKTQMTGGSPHGPPSRFRRPVAWCLRGAGREAGSAG